MTQSHYFLLNQLHWVQSYNSIQSISISRFKQNEFHYLFRIPFNYLDYVFLPFTLHLEDGERPSQSCSDENDWFSPDLTQNTQGE